MGNNMILRNPIFNKEMMVIALLICENNKNNKKNINLFHKNIVPKEIISCVISVIGVNRH